MARASAAERRAEILDAAYEVFAEKGYHEAGIADIAARLGAGHGTFYRYFKNKRDIFVQLVAQVGGRLAEAVAAERPGATNTLEEYRAQTVRWGHRLLDLVGSDPHLSRILLREAGAVDDEISGMVGQAWDACATITELYLINGKKKGFLRANLTTRITAMCVNAMIFEALRRQVGLAGSTESAEAWIDAATSLMFEGIAAPARENREGT